MKLIFILANLKGGGVQKAVVTLAQQCADAGIPARLIVASSLTDEHLDTRGLDVTVLNKKKLVFNMFGLMRELAALEQNDVVVCGQPHINVSVVFAKLILRLKIKIYATEHNPVDVALTAKEKLIQTIKWPLYRKFSGVITVGSDIERQVSERLGDRCPPLRTIYNPVYPPPWPPLEEDLVEYSKNDDQPRRFCCIGRLHVQKNFELAIGAVALYQKTIGPARLQIIGEGPMKAPLLGLAEELLEPDSFEFMGFRADVLELLIKNEILIVSSRWEGFGIVLIEALYLGVKVVSTKCAGPIEILHGGKFGSLCEANVDDLCRALVEEIRASRPRKLLFDHAHSLCSPNRVLEQYIEFINAT